MISGNCHFFCAKLNIKEKNSTLYSIRCNNIEKPGWTDLKMALKTLFSIPVKLQKSLNLAL